MKIVHIINALPKTGGAERMLLDICCASPELELSIILTRNSDQSLLELFPDLKIEIISLRPFKWQTLKKIKKLIQNCDLLHVHLFPSLYLASVIPKPKIYTEHSTSNRRRQYGFFRFIENVIYNKYNKIACISQGTKETLNEWIEIKDTKALVVYNGVDLTRFSNLPRQYSSEKINIGAAGRLTVIKGYNTLIDAIADLDIRVELLIAGEGPEQENLKNQAAKLGISERVKFLGHVNDMKSFYDQVDVFVQPSFVEGFSLTAVEAMASGLPIIGTNIPGLRETVGNEEYLVSPNKPKEIVCCIEKIISNKEFYEKSSKYSLIQSKKFSISNTAQKYKEIYQSILE